ncbi:hypothetical protein IJH02_01140 [Candidatus Saccharibacteria bacterium]|nr:hypothetical protein [Candidatus Saccharibacteria bacterium]
MLDTFQTIVLLVFTALTAFAAVIIVNDLAKQVDPHERGLKPLSVVLTLALPIAAQAALITWAPNIYIYAVIIAVVCVFEILTIRVPKPDLESPAKVESPTQRFVAWICFAAPWVVGMILAGTILPEENPLYFGGKGMLIYLIPPLLVLLIGFCRVLWCRDAYKEALKDYEAVEMEIGASSAEVTEISREEGLEELAAETVEAEPAAS